MANVKLSAIAAGPAAALTDVLVGVRPSGPTDYLFTLAQIQAAITGSGLGTPGSVFFAGAGGQLAQDNAKFFWDDTNFILKIQSELDFQGSTALVKVGGSAVADYGVSTASQWTFAGAQINCGYVNTQYGMAMSSTGVYIGPDPAALHSMYLFGGANTASALFLYNNTFNIGAANFERAVFDFGIITANVLTIGTQQGGTGVARPIQFVNNGNSILDYGVTAVGTWTTAAPFVIGNSFSAPLLTLDCHGNNIGAQLKLQGAHGWTIYAAGSANGTSTFGYYDNSTNATVMVIDGISTNFQVCAGATFGFSTSGNDASQPIDLGISRDAAGILGQKNGLNAQAFRLYNTWSSSGTNYERGVFDWQTTANVLSIGTEKGGTGVSRNMQFVVGGASVLDYGVSTASRWTFSGIVDFTSLIRLSNASSALMAGANNGTASRLDFGWSASTGGTNTPVFTVYDSKVVGVQVLTVATLPAAGTAGRKSFVSDANATTFQSIVAGGGTNKVPVFDDGTNWRIG